MFTHIIRLLQSLSMCSFIAELRTRSPQPRGQARRKKPHFFITGSRCSCRYLSSPTHWQPTSWCWQRTLRLFTCRCRCLFKRASTSEDVLFATLGTFCNASRKKTPTTRVAEMMSTVCQVGLCEYIGTDGTEVIRRWLAKELKANSNLRLHSTSIIKEAWLDCTTHILGCATGSPNFGNCYC